MTAALPDPVKELMTFAQQAKKEADEFIEKGDNKGKVEYMRERLVPYFEAAQFSPERIERYLNSLARRSNQ